MLSASRRVLLVPAVLSVLAVQCEAFAPAMGAASAARAFSRKGSSGPRSISVLAQGLPLRPALRGGASWTRMSGVSDLYGPPPVAGAATLGAPSGSKPGSPAETVKLNPANALGMLDKVDVFIFDCDGVIWRGDLLIPGIPETLEKLRAAGKKVFFVTNNSTKSRKGYKAKFDSLGLNVNPEEIFSSSFAAAAYLEQTRFRDTGKRVYIVGERGIQEELDLIGVPWMGGELDKDQKIELKPGYALPHDPNVGAVIVGFDRNINYYKIQYAQLCINENPGCQFIATNLDAVTHLTDAQEWAGNGSMAGAIKGCTGKDPLVVGKPSPLMIDYIATKFSIDKSKICMVGDRLDTDIVFGNSNGCQSVLTLSGVTTEQKYKGQSEIVADYYCDSIADFF